MRVSRLDSRVSNLESNSNKFPGTYMGTLADLADITIGTDGYSRSGTYTTPTNCIITGCIETRHGTSSGSGNLPYIAFSNGGGYSGPDRNTSVSIVYGPLFTTYLKENTVITLSCTSYIVSYFNFVELYAL